MSYRIGVDIGGTFTDFFLCDREGAFETFKVPSTPEDPSVGVVRGLEEMARSKGLEPGAFAARVDAIVHGTTVTTNAVLTRNGATAGLLTTEGVRDALEMRRGIREEQYDNRCRNVVPLIPRRRRLPVRGRVDARGAEVAPLEPADVLAAVREFRKEGVAAVAVCFLNSFAHPAQEAAAAALVRREMPGAYVSVSSEILPSIRFYNRVSTTALDAFVGPVLVRYLENLDASLRRIGFRGVLLIMQSNGGVALPELTARRAASTLLSGPAAGPRAGATFLRPHGREDCIVVDMGGTSFDASLVQGGDVALDTEGEIDRLRIALPMLAIQTIGAGGGSLGWIDEGGLLRMGPKSAGGLPGPACYGRGGRLPTCTDADLVLGYLDPAYFLGGRLPLDAGLAREAIARVVAGPMRVEVEEAAAGMVRVIDANMAHGVRAITLERGLDPREFPMVVAGGAGPLHACSIARELGIPLLLVPATASILCAAGMLLTDLQHDFVRSFVAPFAEVDPARLRALVEGMVAEGLGQLRREGIPEGDTAHRVDLDLRYLSQYHEVTVPIPAEWIARGDREAVAEAFHATHDRLYGYHLREEGTGLELINVRVRSTGRTPKPSFHRLPAGGEDPGAARKGRRRAFLPDRGAFEEVPVYDGHRLRPGNVVPGPALVERFDTTLFLAPGFVARVDDFGNSLVAHEGGGGHGA